MFCCTEKQIAKIFTKALGWEHFQKNMLDLGMIKIAWTALNDWLEKFFIA